MTNEQLEEIERLAEAETADRWSAAEDGFNAAMRKYALPLVKALREAREEWSYEWEQRHQMEVKLLATEAEVEMLRGVGCGELYEGAEVPDGPCGACLKCLRRERDEARAELGEALDELAFIKEEYGDGDPAEMTADALLLKVKTITLDYNKARSEVERLGKVVWRVHEFVEILLEGWQPEDSKLREMYDLTAKAANGTNGINRPLPCPFHSDGKHRCIGCGDIEEGS